MVMENRYQLWAQITVNSLYPLSASQGHALHNPRVICEWLPFSCAVHNLCKCVWQTCFQNSCLPQLLS